MHMYTHGSPPSSKADLEELQRGHKALQPGREVLASQRVQEVLGVELRGIRAGEGRHRLLADTTVVFLQCEL